MKFLVTGATGNIGARVVERILDRGERPRIFVRDADKARSRWGDRVEVAIGAFEEPATMARAMSGADALLLITSGPNLDRLDDAAAKIAKASGIERLVKLSSADGVQQVGTGVWHARGEAAIRATGVPFVFVRPTGFMDNALFWSRSIKDKGVVTSSTGEGRIPFVHSDDIADVVTRALTGPEYEGRTLTITGPEALSYREMTARIGAAIGRSLVYQTISDDEVRRLQRGWDIDPIVVEAHLSIYRAIREGRLAEVTDDVRRVLGRGAIHFERWIEQNVGAFRDA